MKPLAFTTVLAGLILLSACAKKSSSPDITQPATSYLQFDYNGDSVYLKNMSVDTTRSDGADDSYLMIAGTAIRSTSNDNCLFNMNMGFVGLPVTDYFGNYSPQVIISDVTANKMYSNSFDGNASISLIITKNDGKTMSGNFSGTLSPPNSDSLVNITNGTFAISL